MIEDEYSQQLLSAESHDRCNAVVMLFKSGEQSRPFLPELTKAMDDQDKRVQSAAAATVLALSPDSAKALHVLEHNASDADSGVRQSTIQNLYLVAQSRYTLSLLPLLPAITQLLLLDSDEEVRESAAAVLQRLKLAETIPVLLQSATYDISASVRGRAVGALGWMGENAKAAFPVLLLRLTSEAAEENRETIAWTIEQIGPDPHLALLVAPFLRDRNPFVALRIATLFRRLGIQALPAVSALLEAWSESGSDSFKATVKSTIFLIYRHFPESVTLSILQAADRAADPDCKNPYRILLDELRVCSTD